jgi:hypothetical protein
VLFGYSTVDGRYPAQEDSLTLASILSNYSLEGTKFDHLLLRRMRTVPVESEMRPIAEVMANVGDNIDVPNGAGGPVWCTIHLRTNMGSRLRAALFQPSDVRLEMDAGGMTREYRFLRGPGEVGFVVSPLLADLNTISSLLCGSDVSPTQRIRLMPARGVEGVTARFYAMPRFQATKTFAGCDSVSYPMLGIQPRAIVGRYGRVTAHGKERFLAHAPATVKVDVTSGATVLRGEYGLMPGAYENSGTTDGVIFRVIVELRNGSASTLWESWLRPVGNRRDRGIHAFRIVVPNGAKSLTLHTDPGPNANDSWDWSIWSGVGFEAAPADGR